MYISKKHLWWDIFWKNTSPSLTQVCWNILPKFLYIYTRKNFVWNIFGENMSRFPSKSTIKKISHSARNYPPTQMQIQHMQHAHTQTLSFPLTTHTSDSRESAWISIHVYMQTALHAPPVNTPTHNHSTHTPKLSPRLYLPHTHDAHTWFSENMCPGNGNPTSDCISRSPRSFALYICTHTHKHTYLCICIYSYIYIYM